MPREDVEVLFDGQRPQNARTIRHRVAGIEEQPVIVGEIQKLSQQPFAGDAAAQ
jgi:esterase/lipase superfamily enzyme